MPDEKDNQIDLEMEQAVEELLTRRETKKERRERLGAILTPEEIRKIKARGKKREQRAREAAAGEPRDSTNAMTRLQKEWQANISALTPAEKSNLEDRLNEFNAIRRSMAEVTERINTRQHPNLDADGNQLPPRQCVFYEFVAQDVIEFREKYGLQTYYPPTFILLQLEIMPAPHRERQIDKLRQHPGYHHRIKYGLDIDSLAELEFYPFIEKVLGWYLDHKDDPGYDYDWTTAASLFATFPIPEFYLNPLFSSNFPFRKLDRIRRGLSDEILDLQKNQRLTEVKQRAQQGSGQGQRQFSDQFGLLNFEF